MHAEQTMSDAAAKCPVCRSWGMLCRGDGTRNPADCKYPPRPARRADARQPDAAQEALRLPEGESQLANVLAAARASETYKAERTALEAAAPHPSQVQDEPPVARILQSFARNRCYGCGWPFTEKGCHPFDCGYRPQNDDGWRRRVKEMAELLASPPAAVGAVPADGCCLLDVKRGTPCAMAGFCLKESEPAAVGTHDEVMAGWEAQIKETGLPANWDDRLLISLLPAAVGELDEKIYSYLQSVGNEFHEHGEDARRTARLIAAALKDRASVPGEPK